MRTKFGVVVISALFVPFLQCSGGDDSAAPSSNDAGGNDSSAPSDSGPSGDGSASDSAPATISVNGTLNGAAGTNGPLANREVVVIDANEVVTKTTTDATGKFHATNVATPYDISVPFDPPDAATPGVPRYYAGISVPNPIVNGSDYNTATAVDNTPQQTTLTFLASSCNGGNCFVWVSGPDDNYRASGTGGLSPYSVTYHWYGSATHSAPLHIYTSDNTGVYTSYIDIPSQALVAGGTTALGTPTLATVSNGTLAVSIVLPMGYGNSDSNVEIFHTDGSRIGYGGAVTTLASLANFPQVPGILVNVANSAAGTGTTTRATVVYPEATAPAGLNTILNASPTMTAPANNATGVTSTQVLTWSAYAIPTTYQLVLTPAAGDPMYVYTSTTSVDLARFAKADVGLKSATKYSWLVAAGAPNAVSVDDLVTNNFPAANVVANESDSTTQTFTTQ